MADTVAWLVENEQLRAEVDRLRCGLRQIIEGDYPADAINAETWAGELLADSHCVDWQVDDFGENSNVSSSDIGPAAIASDEASAHAGEAPVREPGGR